MGIKSYDEDLSGLRGVKAMVKKLVLVYIIIAFILGLALDGMAAQKEKPKMGGTVVFGLAKGPGNQNPFFLTSSTTQFIREISYESLLTRDNDDRIIPNLALTYKVSAGGTQFTLRLRKGVKFHNGQEMKADDVVWSANHVKDPKNGV